MGDFIRDIRKMLRCCLPPSGRTCCFGDRFSDEIKALAGWPADQLPGNVEVAQRNTASELVEQSVHLVPQRAQARPCFHAT